MSVTQTAFHDALLDSARAVPAGLGDGHGRPAGRRFAVYRNNVAVSLTEALEAGFPAVARLVGDENFRKLCAVFLRAHPPESPILSQYGAALPAFVEEFAPLAHLGYLPDVARLEQALRESYHAADADALDPGRLQALLPAALAAARLALAPSLRLVRSPWPIHAIWAYNMEADAPEPPALAQTVLVTRPGYDPAMTVIADGTTRFVAALQAGASLEAAAGAGDTEADFDLSTALALLLDAGAITDSATGDPR